MIASAYLKYYHENGRIPPCDDQNLVLACGFLIGAVGMRRLGELIPIVLSVEIAMTAELAKGLKANESA